MCSKSLVALLLVLAFVYYNNTVKSEKFVILAREDHYNYTDSEYSNI